MGFALGDIFMVAPENDQHMLFHDLVIKIMLLARNYMVNRQIDPFGAVINI
jgi:hypothetical protein